MSKSRKKIPDKVADEVLFKADRRCCLCKKRRRRVDHIHHIDENPGNNKFDNLVCLCYKHHNELSKKGGLSRGVSPALLKKYRDIWYEEVAVKRNGQLQNKGKTSSQLNEDVLLGLAIDASVVVEIHKIGNRMYSEKEDGRVDSIYEIASYIDLSGLRSRKEIVKVLDLFTFKTRFRMSSEIARAVSSVTFDALGIMNLHRPRETPISDGEIELLEYGLAIAESLTYDGALYAKKMYMVDAGGELLWKILCFAVINKHEGMKKRALETFDTGEDGATRSGDPDFVALLHLYKNQGLSGNGSYPKYSEQLINRLDDVGD